MKQTLIVLSALILLLTLNKGNKEKDLIIPNDSIRLRVIASSNDEIDIKQKQELKSYLESELIKLTKSIETKEEVDKIIVENIEVINNKISEFLGHNNFKVDYASLSQKERQAFGEMRGMAARFSDNEEELKIPHMYFSKEELLIKARDIQQTIKRSC